MKRNAIILVLLTACLLLASCGNNVVDEVAPKAGIAFKTEPLTLLPGETAQLACETHGDAVVSFFTTDENIIRVDQNGLLTAYDSGTATVVASIGEYDKAYLPVTVAVDVMQSKLSARLEYDFLELLPGESYPLALTVTKDSQEIKDAQIQWSTSNEAVATVAGGIVETVAPGEAVITATASKNGETEIAACRIVVYEYYQIQIQEQLIEASIGKEFTLNTAILNAQGDPVDVKEGELEFFTSNPQAISVRNGKFKVISSGTASAGVRYKGNAASIPVDIFSVTADFFETATADFYGEVSGTTFSGIVLSSNAYQPFFYFSESGMSRIREYALENGYSTLRMHTYPILKNNSYRINGRYLQNQKWSVTDVPVSEITEGFWFWSESEGATEVYMWFEFR